MVPETRCFSRSVALLSLAVRCRIEKVRSAGALSSLFVVGLCFHHRAAGVIFRVRLVFRPVIGDALDHQFRIVATLKSAVGVSPVAFGLALVAGPDRPALMGIANIPDRLGGVSFDCEVARLIHGPGFVMRANDKFFRQFAVREARQPEYARRVGGCRITIELACQGAKERFGVILSDAVYFPDDLVLPG